MSSRPRRILALLAPVGMRKSFNGLAGLVHSVLGEDSLSGGLSLFINRQGNPVQLLPWDRTG